MPDKPHNEQSVLERIGGRKALEISRILQIARESVGKLRKELLKEARERTARAYRESYRKRLN